MFSLAILRTDGVARTIFLPKVPLFNAAFVDCCSSACASCGEDSISGNGTGGGGSVPLGVSSSSIGSGDFAIGPDSKNKW